MINFQPGPVVQSFIAGREFFKILMGPVGGGKSTGALFDLFDRSLNQVPYNNVRRTKHIILRNTSAQLTSTVKPLIDQWFVTLTNGALGSWRVTDKTFEMKARLPDDTVLHTEFILQHADTPDDVRRLLSLECSSAWIEEAREVNEEIVQGLQGRVNRFPNRASGGVTYPGVIASTNPPPLGTYWHGLISKPPKGVGVYIQPAALLPDGRLNPDAENLNNLAPDYYENLISGRSEQWLEVYLMNRFGAGEYGNPVFRSTFKRSFHVADSELQPIMQSIQPLIVGCDNGLTAAAVFMQQDMRGRLNVLGEAFVPEGDTMGFETFLDRILLPQLTARFPFKRENVVFVMDPACWQRSQVNEATIAQAVQRRGYTPVKATTNDPEKRIAAVEALLSRQIDGAAGLLIDPRCTHTIAALDWGYRYRKSSSGSGNPSIEKNHFSHIGDAFQYGCLQVGGVLSPAGHAVSRSRPVQKVAYAWV